LCELFLEELKLCKKLKNFELFAFCILPDHVHLLINPCEEFHISKVMFSIKKQFSQNTNRILGHNPLPVGEQTLVRLRSGDTNSLDLLNKHHKYLQKLRQQIKSQNIHLPKFRWQKSYHDHVMRNEKDFYYHYRYTSYNYRKHNMLENYRYTSLKYSDLLDEITL
jgi:REP element-mobilizing transposase RayT